MEPEAFAARSFVDAALSFRPAGTDRALHASDPAAAAQDFEAFFLAQILNTLQEGESLQSAFGGGPGESAWKSFLNEAYAQAMAKAGGIGLADRLKAEIIALQAQQSQLEDRA